MLVTSTAAINLNFSLFFLSPDFLISSFRFELIPFTCKFLLHPLVLSFIGLMNSKMAGKNQKNYRNPDKHFNFEKSAIIISEVFILKLGMMIPDARISALRQNEFLSLIPFGFL